MEITGMQRSLNETIKVQSMNSFKTPTKKSLQKLQFYQTTTTTHQSWSIDNILGTGSASVIQHVVLG